MSMIKGDWIASLVASLNALVAGFVMGYTSPTIPQLEGGMLSHNEISWYGSLAVLGATLGGLLCQLLADGYGRKSAMVMCSLPYAIGWLLIDAADNSYMLYAGRFVTGISFGMAIPTTSIYVSEVATANNRGMLSMLNNILQMIGLLLVYGLGIIFNWRWLAVIPLFVTFLTICLIVRLPESPRYLILNSRHEEAKECLQWLGRSEEECLQEMNIMTQSHSEELNTQNSAQSNGSNFCVNIVYLIILMILSESTGTMAIFFYGELILIEAGYSGRAGIGQVILGGVRVVCSVLAGPLTDRIGRKTMLIISGGVMMLANLSLGLHFYFGEHHQWQSNWLPLCSLLVDVAAYSVGWGPIPWIYQAELFDIKKRGLSATVGSFTIWTTAFLVALAFIPLQSTLHAYGVFWLFAAICMLSCVFAVMFLPETRQKTLEHITSGVKNDVYDVESSRL